MLKNHQFFIIFFVFILISQFLRISETKECHRELGKEYISDDDKQAIQELEQLFEKTLKQEKQGKDHHADRFQHAKSHGCVNAHFQLLNDIPSELQHGIFSKPGSTFPAVIRFSSAATHPQRDIVPDVRGFALKVYQVPGKKLFDDEPYSQDFLMTSWPTFLFSNIRDTAEGIKVQTTGSAWDKAKFAATHPQAGITTAKMNLYGASISDILRFKFWSESPYALGDQQAMQFRVVPCETNYQLPNNRLHPTDPDYFRKHLKLMLAQYSACFDFYIRPQQDPCEDPIDDPTVEWTGPEYRVARISIPSQVGYLDQEHRDRCERMSFNPFHCLPAQRPLGGINRAREVLYKFDAKTRNHLNGVQPYVPGGAPPSEGTAAPETGAQPRSTDTLRHESTTTESSPNDHSTGNTNDSPSSNQSSSSPSSSSGTKKKKSKKSKNKKKKNASSKSD
eukprot:gb/GECH01007308.1/.p1 GENE.gb/GECH01007308.1/~~gb/GECH01007308.1/.p1  ORF type:complete len:449 (+),score=121.05 gb/GECH01007308.1/:1-1347(+)